VTDAPAKQKKPDPCSFVIFGVTGDLAHRLVIPALYNLAAGKLLPDGFALVGVARAEWSDDEFRDRMRAALAEFATDGVEAKTVDALLRHCRYVRGDFDDLATYDKLKRQLAELGRSAGTPDFSRRRNHSSTERCLKSGVSASTSAALAYLAGKAPDQNARYSE